MIGSFHHVYLIGICGTAMASLAGMLKEKGHRVSGSDAHIYPPMSMFLDHLGIPVYEGYDEDNLERNKPDIVVIGNALSRGNPEIEYVLDHDMYHVSLPEIIREVFLRGKSSVVVSGTHGKTTTAAMLAWILEVAGRDPSLLVGGIARNWGRSFKLGDGREFVIEGDEYDTAFFDKGPKFLHYLPRIVLLNNLEFDHADIYPNLEAVELSFRRLINIVPRAGLIVAGADSPVVRNLIPAAFSRVITFGLSHGQLRARRISSGADGVSFDVEIRGSKLDRFSIPAMGTFNILNALGAIVVARELGVPLERIHAALAAWQGIKRRLEVRGVVDGITIYDDFAHHPTAVLETLRAVRGRFSDSRVWAVFEPRSQSCRRRAFEKALIESLAPADAVVVAPVHAAGRINAEERLSPERVAERLRRQGKPARSFRSTEAILSFLARELRRGDHVVIMSNGAFDRIHEKLIEALNTRGSVGGSV